MGELRLAEFDVLVGINLLREGLDLPEVSLVAILDADKEGFLRAERSLVQTIGRAASIATTRSRRARSRRTSRACAPRCPSSPSANSSSSSPDARLARRSLTRGENSGRSPRDTRVARRSADPTPTIPTGPEVPRAFLDTNVLVYADDADAGRKQGKAQALIGSALANGDAVISTQVLAEYFGVATRKLSVTAEAAQKKVAILAALVAVTIDADHIVESIKLHRLNSVSFWDALIIHAARRAGCDRLLTEDLRAGQRIEGVEIVNPFA